MTPKQHSTTNLVVGLAYCLWFPWNLTVPEKFWEQEWGDFAKADTESRVQGPFFGVISVPNK